MLLVADAAGAALFVVGCVAFYSDAFYLVGVTLFLAGSVLMLGSTVGRIFVRYGPSR